MLQKIKKEKKEKECRNNLKMFTSLLEPTSVPDYLFKGFPNKNLLNSLRITTVLEFNYLISTYFQIVNKLSQLDQFNTSIEDLKIGIIGGGVIGRFFLNSLLVFEKEDLCPQNITLSTRQTEDFEHYSQNFGIKVEFDNEKVAEESDILIITVPSTLDNWVIVDLKESIENRIKKTKNYELQPLIFVTTSNMTPKKVQRLFGYPILTPSIRGEDFQVLKGFNDFKNVQDFEQAVKEKITQKQRILKMSELISFIVDKSFNKTIQSTVSDKSQKKSISIESNQEPEEMTKMELIEGVINSQETAENTFLVRCRKWRMAYHNFVS